MSCTKHFAGFEWKHHDWSRRVTLSKSRTTPATNMWGRPAPIPDVICHAEYVCKNCGVVRDGEDCLCDQDRGDRCAVRLEWIAAGRKPELSARR